MCEVALPIIESKLSLRPLAAVLMPPDEIGALDLLQRLRDFNSDSPETVVAVVARPERQVDDRRLDQIVSPLAPYSEEFLDALLVRGQETT